MKITSKWGLAFSVTIMLGFTGCASVSVFEVKQDAKPSHKPPERIIVESFATPDAAFKVGRKDDALRGFQGDMSETLSSQIVERLSKDVLPASQLSGESPEGVQNAWLISGRFEKVQQGSRLLRSLIGWGAGRTRLETYVEVYDLSALPFRRLLTFKTTGGTNVSPGLATGAFISPISAVAIGIRNSTSGLSGDSKRTAREITAMISESLVEQYEFEPEKKLRPKPLGGFPSSKNQGSAPSEL